MVISPLRRKLLRDLRRLWSQSLAIAAVLAAGVATMILGNGAYSSLSETRARYYTDYMFADVFADATRAPQSLLESIRSIDGVLAAEGRIAGLALLDSADMVEPGAILLVSLPTDPSRGLNRLYLRSGRLPDPHSVHEAVVSEQFAQAHGLRAGSTVSVVMDGRLRELTVTGTALSPEFVYALGPGEMMPDPRRFGIAWMPRHSLEVAYDLKGAFSNLVLKLAPGAPVQEVIARVDRLLAPYGGKGAIGRADQTSHAFLDAELRQLQAMVRILPTTFFLVAAMLVNMMLARLIALEREQIGLLKALGYSSRAVAQSYVEFVVVIAAIGSIAGMAAGAWLGAGLATMYAKFFTFPILVFSRDPQIFGLAVIAAVGSAAAAAVLAVRSAVALPPAVAMSPPAPADYRSRVDLASWLRLNPTAMMATRHLLHRPLRSLSGALGVGMAVAIMIASLWSFGSIDRMIEITFFRAERQDAQIAFSQIRPLRAALDAQHLPGVLLAEPYRAVSARISHQNRSRRLAVMGRPPSTVLSRVISEDLRPMAMPENGLILSAALAEALGVRPGDKVTLDVLEGSRRTLSLQVSGISIGYVGLGASMDLHALNRLVGDGQVISGVNLLVDPSEREAFFRAVKQTPEAQFVTLTERTLGRFEDTLAGNITMMITVFTVLASVIAIGVLYNLARIGLSEQGRELASLRVLGFTQREVAGILFGELAIIVILAQPAGWVIGLVIAWAMAESFSSDLYRVPFVVERGVFGSASLFVSLAALVSMWAVWRRLRSLDMIAVLKTRE